MSEKLKTANPMTKIRASGCFLTNQYEVPRITRAITA